MGHLAGNVLPVNVARSTRAARAPHDICTRQYSARSRLSVPRCQYPRGDRPDLSLDRQARPLGHPDAISLFQCLRHAAVMFSSVTVALQEYSGNVVDGTLTPVTFGGKKSVTIPVGQEVYSDGIRLRWVEGPDD